MERGEFVCVQADTTLREAVELMRGHGYSQLTMLRGERIVGSITENTVLDQLSTPHKPDLDSKVGRVMDEPPPQLDIDTPLTRVIDILKTYPTIIIQNQEQIKGTLTTTHIIDSIMTNNETSHNKR
ncbi:MAG: CBS domain-containing protein [Candidatus Bathyarchaeia archaeon]